MAANDKTHLAQTALRLSPVFTSAVGATFSYAFGVFFAGFRPSTSTNTNTSTGMPASAKWDAMPHWFRSVRARGLRTIFLAYNSSIILGGANALLFWSVNSSPSSLSAPSSPISPPGGGWSRAAYAAGTLFSVAYYAYTFSLRLVPMNLVLADEANPVARREEAERDLARLDWRRTLTTGGPAAVSFFVGALLWFAGR